MSRWARLFAAVVSIDGERYVADIDIAAVLRVNPRLIRRRIRHNRRELRHYGTLLERRTVIAGRQAFWLTLAQAQNLIMIERKIPAAIVLKVEFCHIIDRFMTTAQQPTAEATIARQDLAEALTDLLGAELGGWMMRPRNIR
jgi:hypothetical protein